MLKPFSKVEAHREFILLLQCDLRKKGGGMT